MCDLGHDGKVFNYETTLARLGGDSDLFREMVAYFGEDVPLLIESARAALARGDRREMERAAHSLKGLAANFGGERCLAAAREVERLGPEGNRKEIAAALARLEIELNQLTSALQALTAE